MSRIPLVWVLTRMPCKKSTTQKYDSLCGKVSLISSARMASSRNCTYIIIRVAPGTGTSSGMPMPVSVPVQAEGARVPFRRPDSGYPRWFRRPPKNLDNVNSNFDGSIYFKGSVSGQLLMTLRPLELWRDLVVLVDVKFRVSAF